MRRGVSEYERVHMTALACKRRRKERNHVTGVAGAVPISVDALPHSALIVPDRVPARFPRRSPHAISADNSRPPLKCLASCGSCR